MDNCRHFSPAQERSWAGGPLSSDGSTVAYLGGALFLLIAQEQTNFGVPAPLTGCLAQKRVGLEA